MKKETPFKKDKHHPDGIHTWIQLMDKNRIGKVLTNIKFETKEGKDYWFKLFQSYANTMPVIDNIRFVKLPYSNYQIESYIPIERNGKEFLSPYVITFNSKNELLEYVQGYLIGFDIGVKFSENKPMQHFVITEGKS